MEDNVQQFDLPGVKLIAAPGVDVSALADNPEMATPFVARRTKMGAMWDNIADDIAGAMSDLWSPDYNERKFASVVDSQAGAAWVSLRDSGVLPIEHLTDIPMYHELMFADGSTLWLASWGCIIRSAHGQDVSFRGQDFTLTNINYRIREWTRSRSGSDELQHLVDGKWVTIFAGRDLRHTKGGSTLCGANLFDCGDIPWRDYPWLARMVARRVRWKVGFFLRWQVRHKLSTMLQNLPGVVAFREWRKRVQIRNCSHSWVVHCETGLYCEHCWLDGSDIVPQEQQEAMWLAYEGGWEDEADEDGVE